MTTKPRRRGGGTGRTTKKELFLRLPLQNTQNNVFKQKKASTKFLSLISIKKKLFFGGGEAILQIRYTLSMVHINDPLYRILRSGSESKSLKKTLDQDPQYLAMVNGCTNLVGWQAINGRVSGFIGEISFFKTLNLKKI